MPKLQFFRLPRLEDIPEMQSVPLQERKVLWIRFFKANGGSHWQGLCGVPVAFLVWMIGYWSAQALGKMMELSPPFHLLFLLPFLYVGQWLAHKTGLHLLRKPFRKFLENNPLRLSD